MAMDHYNYSNNFRVLTAVSAFRTNSVLDLEGGRGVSKSKFLLLVLATA